MRAVLDLLRATLDYWRAKLGTIGRCPPHDYRHLRHRAEQAEAREAELREECERLHEALKALHDSDTTCASEPTAPCASLADELEFPTDWCFPCYVKETIRAALAASTGETTDG